MSDFFLTIHEKWKGMRKRITVALLTMMLILAALPKAALAAPIEPDPNPANSTIDMEYSTDTLGTNDGTVSRNLGTVLNNNGTVNNNYGTVSKNNNTVNNKGRLEGRQLLGYGTVTTNHGEVYNAGYVVNNGDSDGAKPGIVYNDHGWVGYNCANSTVHNYGGFVFGNVGLAYNYGDSGGVVSDPSVKVFQYRKVTINGSSVDRVEVSGLTDTIFDAKWVLSDSAVTLTPKPGYYFALPPSAVGARNVVKVGEAYQVTNINADTTITLDGVSVATGVDFSDIDANGNDTETTSRLTLTFDQDIADLTADDLTVTGATKGTLMKVASSPGVYTLAVSDITVDDRGSVSVAVQKHGFAFSPKQLNVTVRKFTPPAVTITPTRGTRFLQGSAPSDAVFTVTTDSTGRPLSAANFDNATLDGVLLDLGTPDGAAGADGTVTTGSVVVTVLQTRLAGLSPGDHTIVITLRDGAYAGRTVTGVIAVVTPGADGNANDAIPKTGDSTPVALLIGSMLLAGVILAVRLMRRREL